MISSPQQVAINPPAAAIWDPDEYYETWKASRDWIGQLEHENARLHDWIVEDARHGERALSPIFAASSICESPERGPGGLVYQPDEHDRRFFTQVRNLIASQPELFRAAGQALDTRYAWRNIRARERAKEARLPEAWRLANDARRMGARIPRASSRNIPYGRVMACVSDLLGERIDFTTMRREERCRRAALVVLVTWLLSDPDAGDPPLGLTDLESKLWLLDSSPVLMPLFRDNAVERDWLALAKAAFECLADSAAGDETGNARADVAGPTDDEQPKALSRSAELVIHALGTFSAEILATNERIAGAMPLGQALSTKRIGEAVRDELMPRRLVERPLGERKGVRLTLAGRRLEKSLAASG
ncbi:MAG: hypothetical protein KJZ69_09505 [Phycisphaerales bacterium]|nr:hypothetical protein [Phycisphaerales bacterium]